MSRKGDAVQLLSIDLLAAGLEPEREYRFHPQRKWRFDFAFPEQRVAVEVDGGTWTGGRHTTGKGFEADLVKLNHATTLGWRVLRYTSGMVRDGGVVDDIRAVMEGRGT